MYESGQNIRQRSILILMENIYLPLKRVQVVLSVQCVVLIIWWHRFDFMEFHILHILPITPRESQLSCNFDFLSL